MNKKILIICLVAPVLVVLFAIGMTLEGNVPVGIFVVCFIAILFILLRNQTIHTVVVQNLKRPTRPFLISSLISLLILPLLQINQPYVIYIETSAYVLATMALGLCLTLGLAGMVDLGIGFFIGVGAYLAARMSKDFSISAIVTPFLGGLVSMIIARALASTISKVRGHYFAVATLGLGLLGYNLFIQLKTFTLGVDGIGGIPSLKIFQFDASKSITLFSKVIPYQISVYYWVLLFFVLMFLFVGRLSSSHFGRCLKSLRDNEQAAFSMGINVPLYRSWAYAMSSFIGGYAGALHAHTVNYISPDDFGLQNSIFLLAIAVLGGVGNPIACVFAVFGMTFLQEKFREFGDLRLPLISVALLAIVILRAKRNSDNTILGSTL